MEKEFVTYEQALALKALGFDEPCLGLYREDGSFLYADVFSFREPYSPSEFKEGVDEGVYYINSEILEELVTAPTFSQAFRFFREKYNLSGLPTHQSYEIWNLVTNECFIEVYPLNSFRESELACLNKLIEIVGKAKQG